MRTGVEAKYHGLERKLRRRPHEVRLSPPILGRFVCVAAKRSSFIRTANEVRSVKVRPGGFYLSRAGR